MIETIKFRFTPDIGAATDAFEGLNQEADDKLNELLEQGYREVFREIIPPENGRFTHLVIVKLWKTDEPVVEVSPKSSFIVHVDPGVPGEDHTFVSHLNGESVTIDHAPTLSHSWNIGSPADAIVANGTPVPTAPIKRAPHKTAASAKSKRTPRKTK